MKDTNIVRIAIHPSIGIARVGNSPNDYFIGPEVVDPYPVDPGLYWDNNGALKRQAVRFRLYGYNSSGEVIQEVTPDNAKITWKVHVANKKAFWYRFVLSMDIPEASKIQAKLRNNDIKNRNTLILDGGLKSISGKEAQGNQYKFTVSEFGGYDISLYLGELRTDEFGHLIFLGGQGVSSSPSGRPIYDPNDMDSFPNADGWYDDISDGPVTADVTIEGRQIPVDGAWVITAPPNYGGNIVGIRTIYDLLYDLYIRSGWITFPDKISFTKHIFPILQRLKNLQWANKGFAIQFGHNSPNDFENPEYLLKISDSSPTFEELRLQILNSFRDPDSKDSNVLAWPWIYGDAIDFPPENTPRQYMSLSPTQYQFLRLWVEGKFESDWNKENNEEYHSLDNVPISEQPLMLDKASLHYCVADAFHPGIEFTWPIRHITIYSSPFRIRHRQNNQSEADYGKVLTQQRVLGIDGPLYSQGPGDLTRWMALPWQMDTASCRSGYDLEYDPFIPTFWPARVPNHVLTLEDYLKVMDTSLPREKRLAAFWNRLQWTRNLHGTAVEQMTQMVIDFSKMGILERRQGIAKDPDIPAIMMIESLPPTSIKSADTLTSKDEKESGERVEPIKRVPEITRDKDLKTRHLEKAGWESEEILESFKKIIRGISIRK